MTDTTVRDSFVAGEKWTTSLLDLFYAVDEYIKAYGTAGVPTSIFAEYDKAEAARRRMVGTMSDRD